MEWPNSESKVPSIFQKWEKWGHFSNMMRIELPSADVLCRISQPYLYCERVSSSYSSGAVLPIAGFFLGAPLRLCGQMGFSLF